MDLFKELNNFLFSTGLKWTENKALRVLQLLVIWFHGFIILTPRAVMNLMRIPEKGELDIFLNINFTAYFTGLLLMLLNSAYNLSPRNTCIKQMCEFFGRQEKQRLRQRSKRLVVICCSAIAVYSIVVSIFFLNRFKIDFKTLFNICFKYEPDQIYLHHKIICISYLMVLLPSSYALHFIPFMIYLFFMNTVSTMAESLIFSVLTLNDLSKLKKFTYFEIRKLRIMFRRCQDLCDLGNDAFGFIPFMLVCIFFLDITTRVSNIIMRPEKYKIITYLFQFTPIMSTIIVIIFYSEHISEQFERAKREVLKLNDIDCFDEDVENDISKFGYHVMASPKIQLYAWNSLKLNRSLLLSLFGTLIPLILMIVTTFSPTNKCELNQIESIIASFSCNNTQFN